MTAIGERVAAGAAFLDEHQPGWALRIDLDTLKLNSPCRCILGQLWQGNGAYRAALDALNVAWPRSIGLGFDQAPRTSSHDWGALTREWKRIIKQRRAGTP